MSFPTFNSGDILTAADMNAVGLWLVKTQTIGSAQPNVSVTNAFSSTYDNYRITISGGSASANCDLRMHLEASSPSAYYYGGVIRTYAASTVGFEGANVAYWFVGNGSAQTLSMCIDILNPGLANETSYMALVPYTYTTGAGGYTAGYHNKATAYTDFVITPSTGTITGGLIKVYGYRN